MIRPTPPGLRRFHPAGPMPTRPLPSVATYLLFSKLTTLPVGSVIVTSSRSLMPAGSVPAERAVVDDRVRDDDAVSGVDDEIRVPAGESGRCAHRDHAAAVRIVKTICSCRIQAECRLGGERHRRDRYRAAVDVGEPAHRQRVPLAGVERDYWNDSQDTTASGEDVEAGTKSPLILRNCNVLEFAVAD